MPVSLSFFIAWLSLLAAPPMAIATFFIIRWLWPHAIRNVVIGCVALIILVACAMRSDVSFTATVANFAGLSAAYVAYCFVAISAWALRSRPLRILTLVATAIPVVAGYALGTVGALALIFIVGDYAEPPIQTASMADNLECRITGWGMATTDSGYIVHLYKRWPAMPLLDREVARIVVNETNPVDDTASASCDDALAKR